MHIPETKWSGIHVPQSSIHPHPRGSIHLHTQHPKASVQNQERGSQELVRKCGAPGGGVHPLRALGCTSTLPDPNCPPMAPAACRKQADTGRKRPKTAQSGAEGREGRFRPQHPFTWETPASWFGQRRTVFALCMPFVCVCACARACM